MKSLRLRITHLRRKVETKLSKGENLYGYDGISRNLIDNSLNESYALLSTLEKEPNSFEVIFTKREVSRIIDILQNFLDKDFTQINIEQEFNKFLNYILKLRYVIKDCHISITEEPFRIDTELIVSKEKLEELKLNIDATQEIYDKIYTMFQSSQQMDKELSLIFNKISKDKLKSEEFIQTFDSIITDLKGASDRINVWKEEIKNIKEDIAEKQVNITTLNSEVEKIKEVSENLHNELIESKIKLLDQIETNTTLQDQIKDTIDDANRYGMAGSFKLRKDELRKSQLWWAIATIASLIGLIIISIFIVMPLLDDTLKEDYLSSLIIKIPLFASAIWLGWFCSKQYGFTSRIREDYSYKYAISMAFEGYKKEASSINDELLKELIEQTISNISKNPVNLFNTKHNHASPYHEVIESFIKSLSKKKRSDIAKDLIDE